MIFAFQLERHFFALFVWAQKRRRQPIFYILDLLSAQMNVPNIGFPSQFRTYFIQISEWSFNFATKLIAC